MVQRTRITLDALADYNNLSLATWKAVRGKRHRPDVQAFLADAAGQLSALSNRLRQQQLEPTPWRGFWINDPKRRLIHATTLKHRIVHHAILNLAEPTFERTLLPTAYACRPGLGVHRSVADVQRQLRRYPWFVKVDMAGYFPAIDHQIALALIQRRIKGGAFLDLVAQILGSFCSNPGEARPRGLPIGALTSQHIANLYLDGADRFLLEQAGARAHVRYMDDIVWWCDSRAQAREQLQALRVWLLEHRRLVLKPSVQIGRSERGISYCGWRWRRGLSRVALSLEPFALNFEPFALGLSKGMSQAIYGLRQAQPER